MARATSTRTTTRRASTLVPAGGAARTPVLSPVRQRRGGSDGDGRVTGHPSSTSRRRTASACGSPTSSAAQRPARLPPVRVHPRLRRGGARPAGEPGVLPERPDRDRLRLLRHARRPPGVEGGARRRVRVRLGFLGARCGREGVRRLQRAERRPASRHVPDRQGRDRHLVARQGRGRAPDGDGAGVARHARTDRVSARSRGVGRSGGPGSSAFTASRVTGATSRGSRRRSRTSTCWRPTCSATAPRPTSRRGASTTHARRASRRSAPSPPSWIGHSFGGRLAFELAARPPGLVDGSCCSIPAILIPPGRAARRGERPARAGVRLVRGRDRPPLRREPAPPGTARARREGAARPPRRSEDGPLALSLLPGGGGRGVRRDGVAPPPFEQRPRPDPARPRRESYLPYDHLLDAHAQRSATCSRSSASPAGTPCSGTRSTRRPPQSPLPRSGRRGRG